MFNRYAQLNSISENIIEFFPFSLRTVSYSIAFNPEYMSLKCQDLKSMSDSLRNGTISIIKQSDNSHRDIFKKAATVIQVSNANYRFLTFLEYVLELGFIIILNINLIKKVYTCILEKFINLTNASKSSVSFQDSPPTPNLTINIFKAY